MSTTDPVERAWAKHLELLALMAAPGADIDVDPLDLAERIPPQPPPPPPARVCSDCGRPEVDGRGRCSRCRTRWERANPEQVAADRHSREQALAGRRQRVAALRAAGRSLSQIAADVGVSKATVIADLRAKL